MKKGHVVEFSFMIPTAQKASLLVGKDFRPMTKNPDGSFSLTVVPAKKGDTISLLIPTSGGGTSYQAVLRYTVVE